MDTQISSAFTFVENDTIKDGFHLSGPIPTFMAASVVQPPETRALVYITCEGNISDLCWPRKLKRIIACIRLLVLNANKQKHLKVNKVEPWNSVRITLNLPREAAIQLQQLAQQGDGSLQALGILTVQLDGQQAISLRRSPTHQQSSSSLLSLPSTSHQNGGLELVDHHASSSNDQSLPVASGPTKSGNQQPVNDSGNATTPFVPLLNGNSLPAVSTQVTSLSFPSATARPSLPQSTFAVPSSLHHQQQQQKMSTPFSHQMMNTRMMQEQQPVMLSQQKYHNFSQPRPPQQPQFPPRSNSFLATTIPSHSSATAANAVLAPTQQMPPQQATSSFPLSNTSNNPHPLPPPPSHSPRQMVPQQVHRFQHVTIMHQQQQHYGSHTFPQNSGLSQKLQQQHQPQNLLLPQQFSHLNGSNLGEVPRPDSSIHQEQRKLFSVPVNRNNNNSCESANEISTKTPSMTFTGAPMPFSDSSVCVPSPGVNGGGGGGCGQLLDLNSLPDLNLSSVLNDIDAPPATSERTLFTVRTPTPSSSNSALPPGVVAQTPFPPPHQQQQHFQPRLPFSTNQPEVQSVLLQNNNVQSQQALQQKTLTMVSLPASSSNTATLSQHGPVSVHYPFSSMQQTSMFQQASKNSQVQILGSSQQQPRQVILPVRQMPRTTPTMTSTTPFSLSSATISESTAGSVVSQSSISVSVSQTPPGQNTQVALSSPLLVNLLQSEPVPPSTGTILPAPPAPSSSPQAPVPQQQLAQQVRLYTQPGGNQEGQQMMMMVRVHQQPLPGPSPQGASATANFVPTTVQEMVGQGGPSSTIAPLPKPKPKRIRKSRAKPKIVPETTEPVAPPTLPAKFAVSNPPSTMVDSLNGSESRVQPVVMNRVVTSTSTSHAPTVSSANNPLQITTSSKTSSSTPPSPAGAAPTTPNRKVFLATKSNSFPVSSALSAGAISVSRFINPSGQTSNCVTPTSLTNSPMKKLSHSGPSVFSASNSFESSPKPVVTTTFKSSPSAPAIGSGNPSLLQDDLTSSKPSTSTLVQQAERFKTVFTSNLLASNQPVSSSPVVSVPSTCPSVSSNNQAAAMVTPVVAVQSSLHQQQVETESENVVDQKSSILSSSVSSSTPVEAEIESKTESSCSEKEPVEKSIDDMKLETVAKIEDTKPEKDKLDAIVNSPPSFNFMSCVGGSGATSSDVVGSSFSHSLPDHILDDDEEDDDDGDDFGLFGHGKASHYLSGSVGSIKAAVSVCLTSTPSLPTITDVTDESSTLSEPKQEKSKEDADSLKETIKEPPVIVNKPPLVNGMLGSDLLKSINVQLPLSSSQVPVSIPVQVVMNNNDPSKQPQIVADESFVAQSHQHSLQLVNLGIPTSVSKLPVSGTVKQARKRTSPSTPTNATSSLSPVKKKAKPKVSGVNSSAEVSSQQDVIATSTVTPTIVASKPPPPCPVSPPRQQLVFLNASSPVTTKGTVQMVQTSTSQQSQLSDVAVSGSKFVKVLLPPQQLSASPSALSSSGGSVKVSQQNTQQPLHCIVASSTPTSSVGKQIVFVQSMNHNSDFLQNAGQQLKIITSSSTPLASKPSTSVQQSQPIFVVSSASGAQQSVVMVNTTSMSTAGAMATKNEAVVSGNKIQTCFRLTTATPQAVQSSKPIVAMKEVGTTIRSQSETPPPRPRSVTPTSSEKRMVLVKRGSLQSTDASTSLSETQLAQLKQTMMMMVLKPQIKPPTSTVNESKVSAVTTATTSSTPVSVVENASSSVTPKTTENSPAKVNIISSSPRTVMVVSANDVLSKQPTSIASNTGLSQNYVLIRSDGGSSLVLNSVPATSSTSSSSLLRPTTIATSHPTVAIVSSTPSGIGGNSTQNRVSSPSISASVHLVQDLNANTIYSTKSLSVASRASPQPHLGQPTTSITSTKSIPSILRQSKRSSGNLIKSNDGHLLSSLGVESKMPIAAADFPGENTTPQPNTPTLRMESFDLDPGLVKLTSQTPSSPTLANQQLQPRKRARKSKVTTLQVVPLCSDSLLANSNDHGNEGGSSTEDDISSLDVEKSSKIASSSSRVLRGTSASPQVQSWGLEGKKQRAPRARKLTNDGNQDDNGSDSSLLQDGEQQTKTTTARRRTRSKKVTVSDVSSVSNNIQLQSNGPASLTITTSTASHDELTLTSPPTVIYHQTTANSINNHHQTDSGNSNSSTASNSSIGSCSNASNSLLLKRPRKSLKPIQTAKQHSLRSSSSNQDNCTLSPAIASLSPLPPPPATPSPVAKRRRLAAKDQAAVK